MQTSESIKNLAVALCKAQGELKDVKKDKQGYGYKYATLESILSMARPVLAKNGLCIIQMHGNNEDRITVTTRILHASGEWIEDSGSVVMQQLKGMNTAQVLGAYITYLRRYQISAMLNITSDEDVDSEPDVAQMKKNKKEPVQKPFNLREYLTKKGIKDFKGFALYFKINNDERVKEVSKDLAGLNNMIEEFRKKQLP